ncbi:MAG: HU family DNA-binding protein [Chloroflexota bacterium]|nr:HU family DNA-binding protein [Chloroflexota bacterium]
MPNVSTQQLIETVAERTGLPKAQAKQAVAAVMEAISEQLAAGNRIQLSGFGSFDVRERSERQGMNPKTKEKMTIPASKAVGFRAASQLKQRVGTADGE